MKKTFTFFISLTAALFLVIGASSCSKKSQIVGEWNYVKECVGDNCKTGGNATFIFMEDGTFSIGSGSDPAKWSIQDNLLIIKNEYSNRTTHYTIKELTSSNLAIQRQGSNSVMHFKKK